MIILQTKSCTDVSPLQRKFSITHIILWILLACVVFGCELISSTAMADDKFPPPWSRTMPTAMRATYESWNLGAFQPNRWLPADSVLNPPLPHVQQRAQFNSNGSYISDLGGRSGVLSFNSGDSIWLLLDNHNDNPPSKKDIWLQITFMTDSSTDHFKFIIGSTTDAEFNKTISDNQHLLEVENFYTLDDPLPDENLIASGTNWITRAYNLGSIVPNPQAEAIEFIFNSDDGQPLYVDQFVVDTISTVVPEPSTFIMFTAGLAAFWIARKKKTKSVQEN